MCQAGAPKAIPTSGGVLTITTARLPSPGWARPAGPREGINLGNACGAQFGQHVHGATVAYRWADM